ncbi:MAG: hypothetical protein LBQ38_13885, partial [Spirochaetaceae bacterium]|nr:hypothetical protein [Spirochaetaceae bacterium]
MIKSIVAYSTELDDPETAVPEIMDMLKPEQNFLKNSLGIIICHVEFTEPLIIKNLCKKLPFPVIGICSIASAVPDRSEEMLLSVMVLTSDDVFFSAGLS